MFPDKKIMKYEGVGSICESSDYFGKAVDLNKIKLGEIIVIKLSDLISN